MANLITRETGDKLQTCKSPLNLGTTIPLPWQPVEEPNCSDQGIDLARGIDADAVVGQLQAEGRASNASAEVPLDQNLTCPVCRTVFRKGEIQTYILLLIV